MYTDELRIPDSVLSDPEAFEIMRLWAAHEELHVTLNSDLSGGAEDFGELLSDLFEHAARMFAERDGQSVELCRTVMLADFMARVKAPKESIEGGIVDTGETVKAH
ncbi:DUF5076 domain-containing protein [Stenotrophomonas sp.]|uniref:DUF5076 domain-containing protein n=1 Tax=Stenotrophomonas sp. TaxID=69392 RepID=UPI0028B04BA8|nr:DUF5076 domain-containing protein [Stenotrophomonas sp.]